MQTALKLMAELLIEGTNQQVGSLSTVQINPDLESYLSLPPNELLEKYYLNGVVTTKEGRAGDADIIKKKCVVFDLDIRSLLPHLTDEVIKGELYQRIHSILAKSTVFCHPNAIVFSGNGYHLYYISKESYDCEGLARVWSENYERLVDELNKMTGTGKEVVDVSCRNIGRVFRLPGSWNSKHYFKREDGLWTHGNTQDESLWHKVEVLESQFDVYHDVMVQQLLVEKGGVFSMGPLEKYDENGGEYEAMSGNRNNTAAKMAGYILKRVPVADWDKIGWRAFKVWNQEKCVPPLAESELKAVWGSISKRAFNMGPTKTVPTDDISQFFDENKSYFTWGINGGDDHFPLLQSKRLLIMSGDPGSGKTTWAFQLALENGWKGHKVAFISLEMSSEAIKARYIWNKLGITRDQRRRKLHINDAIKAMFKAEWDKLNEANVDFIDTNSSQDIGDIEILKQFLLKNPQYEIVVIDNFSFLRNNAGLDEYETASKVAPILKMVVNDTGACLVVLHHHRKSSSASKSALKTLDDLKGNNNIAIICDFAVAISNEFRELTDEEKENKKSEGKAFNSPKQRYITVLKDRDDGILTKQPIKYINGEIKLLTDFSI